jgi:hypothetical protein
LEEVFRGEDGEGRQETRIPVQQAEQRSTSPPAKGTGWDELRRQLEQMLGGDEVSHETKPIVPAPKEQPRPEPAPIQKTEPMTRPVPGEWTPPQSQRAAESAPTKRTPVRPSRTQPRPAQASVQRVRRKPSPSRKPVPAMQPSVRIQPQPVRAPQQSGTAVPRGVHYRRRGGFPNLHPDPLANAILLSEILRPHSRKSGPGRRPPYGAG